MGKHPRDAVILAALRTPFGKIGGALASVRPDDLLAHCLKDATVRSNIPISQFEEVFVGCANQAGEDNRNIARMSVLLAGFPDTLPALTVNRLCASGLEAVVQAARSIRVGDANLVIAGGVESMSRAPWVLAKPEKAFASSPPEIYDTSLGWRFPNPKLAQRFPLESMGETAENLADLYSITRVEQDRFALESHQKAVKAQKEGYLKKSITPVIISSKSGPSVVDRDEGPRDDSSLEKLSALKPIFRKNGTITAGNSSTLNDGAATLILASREYADAHGLSPMATILGSASAGVSPSLMGIGPVPATRSLLSRLRMSIADIDLVELNEAFAAQALAVTKELSLDLSRVNIFGGALAIGHPLGASGARILTSLIDALDVSQKGIGLATLCVGVGQGLSVLIKKD